MGGKDENGQANTVLEMSILEGNGRWNELPSMTKSRDSFSAAVLDNEIFAGGGIARCLFVFTSKVGVF